MKNRKYKKFEELTGKCYSSMIGAESDGSCWRQAFELLKEIILEERQANPDFAPELEMVDDATDYAYDVQGWLEDCLDEVDMKREYEVLLEMCDDLLALFRWPEYSASDIKFRKSSALEALGQNAEAVEYCRNWIQEEPENIVAAVAGVYAFIAAEEFVAAEELIQRFISETSECTEENDIMFTAASKFYEATGNKKAKKRVDKAMKTYEKYLEEYFDSVDEDDDEFSFMDEELPFI